MYDEGTNTEHCGLCGPVRRELFFLSFQLAYTEGNDNAVRQDFAKGGPHGGICSGLSSFSCISSDFVSHTLAGFSARLEVSARARAVVARAVGNLVRGNALEDASSCIRDAARVVGRKLVIDGHAQVRIRGRVGLGVVLAAVASEPVLLVRAGSARSHAPGASRSAVEDVRALGAVLGDRSFC